MRILAVDDDPTMLKMVQAVLRSGGHEVVTTADPARVLPLLAEREVALLVVDQQMPTITGEALVEQVRAGHRGRPLGILMLSGRDGTDDRRRALAAGADRFLGKPFDREELLATVAAMVPEPLAPPLFRNQLVVLLEQLDDELADVAVTVGGAVPGRIEVAAGRVVVVRAGHLEGAEALLELLLAHPHELTVERCLAAAPALAASFVAFPRVVLEAAWVEAGLARLGREDTGERLALRLAADAWPVLDRDGECLAVGEVLELLRDEAVAQDRPVVPTPAALSRSLGLAPSRLRLALAWLVDAGVLAPDATSQGLPA